MSENTEVKTYDSGIPADEDTTIVEEVEAAGGIEILAAKMVARIEERQDRENESFDPDLEGYEPCDTIILAIAGVAGLDSLEEAEQHFLQLALPRWYGEKNPDSFYELWLDSDGPEFTRADGTTGTSPTRMLHGVWLAGHTPTAVYFEDARIFQGVDSEFPEWTAVSMRQFATKADCVRHLRSQRPGNRPEDLERQRKQLASVREALAGKLRTPQEDDPADPDNA